MTLRIVFMGTPDFSVPTLAEILGAGHEVVAAYTQPSRPAGRGMAERLSPVARFAANAGIPVKSPTSLKRKTEQREFASLKADAAVVVAYGLLLPRPVLAVPRLGCFNLHASALPRWRGAAPIQRAIMAGDAETAVMVMRMEEGLDTGPVCLAEPVAIGPEVTAGELHDELARCGASLMVRALGALERGLLSAHRSRAEARHTLRRSTRRRPASTSRGPRVRFTTSSVGCHRFRAPGLRQRLPGRSSGSRCSARALPMGVGFPARCSTMRSPSRVVPVQSVFWSCSAPARSRWESCRVSARISPGPSAVLGTECGRPKAPAIIGPAHATTLSYCLRGLCLKTCSCCCIY